MLQNKRSQKNTQVKLSLFFVDIQRNFYYLEATAKGEHRT